MGAQKILKCFNNNCDVYTKADEQNYAWSVFTEDKGYTTNKYIVKESSVYLYLKNGWIALYSFGGETTVKSKKCIDANEGDNYKTIYASCKNAIMNYRTEGDKWLKRYKTSFREDEIIALLDVSKYYEKNELPIPRNRSDIIKDFISEKFIKPVSSS